MLTRAVAGSSLVKHAFCLCLLYKVITELKKKKGIKLDLEMEAEDWKEVSQCRTQRK